MMAAIRPRLLQWVLEGTDTVLEFQKRCGVVPVATPSSGVVGHKKNLSDSDKGNESDSDEKAGASKQFDPRDKIAQQFYQQSVAEENSETKKPTKVYGVPTNFFLHWLFTLGTAAGHEIFYIFILPFVYWNANHIISRRIVTLWVITYYTGQACKDWLKLPRPPSPPVLRLSNFYEAEYGMPSTHAMGAVAISFSLVLATYQVGYDISLVTWLLVAALYTTVVCLSRLYMGAHTVPDLIAGLILSFGILGMYLLVGEAVDTWLATSWLVPLVVPVIAVSLLWIYPAPKIWSESYGDTASFLAVGTGGILAHWTVGTPALMPGSVPDDSLLSLSNLGVHCVRCLAGYFMIVLCRSVVKQTCLFFVPRLVLSPDNEYKYNQPLYEGGGAKVTTTTTTTTPLPVGEAKSALYAKYFWGGYHQNYGIEIPTKLITYGIIAYNGIFTDNICDYFGLTL